MLTKPEIACAIIEGISSVREDEELQDFVVEVEGTEFKCHRLILSACSGLFRGLLRSGMKESQKQRTKLEGVSTETFTAILETLYTGCDNLTRENMLSIWLVADQLQITFIFENCVDFITKKIAKDNVIEIWEAASQLMHTNIIELCEKFIISNTSLRNWNIIYETANKLASDLILSHVRDFMKNNFEQVIKSEAFLYLSENDLLEIIKSQDLVVSSEDVVVQSILTWINNGNQIKSVCMAEDLNENSSSFHTGEEEDEKEEELEQGEKVVKEEEGDKDERKENVEDIAISPKYSKEYRMKCLESFLSETRLCLVNAITLEKLSHDDLIMEDKRIRAMVMDAALYKSIGRQHGQSLKAAVHRSCSGLINVAVYSITNGLFSVFSYKHKKNWLEIPSCPYLVNCSCVNLIAYESYFIAVGDVAENSSVCVFVQNEWRELMKLPGHGWLGVAVDDFVFLFNSSNQQIKRFDPRQWNCLFEDLISFPVKDKIEHVSQCEFFILAFCSEVIDETAVHCLDTRSQTWTRLESLDGSAKNMHSFRKEKQLYSLQANGNLWEINSDEINGVHFKLVDILWQGISNMYGVIYINEHLCFSFGKGFEDDAAYSASSKLFDKIRKICCTTDDPPLSNIVPAVLKTIAAS
ncbi:unnamed protein product [Lymnaea stagnalis]|uniref:BTB domain-containing protein n=1 Tax=Lymnaea stagnalis TaxID=6523 RepID=A0AAV2HZN2_LYMST